MTGHFTAFIDVADQRRSTSRTLPADVQKILLEEGKKAGDEMTRLTLELQKDYVDKFKAAGVTFVDDVDLAAFQKATDAGLQGVPEVDARPARDRDGRAEVSGRADVAGSLRRRGLGAMPPAARALKRVRRPVRGDRRLRRARVVVLSVSWGVITRYITAQPAAWASEVATLAFAWVVFFGAAACIKYRLHPTIDMLVARLPRAAAARRALAQPRAAARLLRLHGLVRHALRHRRLVDNPSPVLRLPLTWLYGPVAFCFALMIVRYLQVLRRGPWQIDADRETNAG